MNGNMDALTDKIRNAIGRVDFGKIDFTVQVQDGNPVYLENSSVVDGIKITQKEPIGRQRLDE